LIKQEKKDLLRSEAYISQICPLVFVIPNYFWNFDAQTILQLKPQCMIKNSFFLYWYSIFTKKCFFGCNVYKPYIFVLWSCFRRLIRCNFSFI